MMQSVSQLIQELKSGKRKALARCISLVENEAPESEEILSKLSERSVPVIGITGPPGAGKSTLVNAILSELLNRKKKIGVIAVDPTSPFNGGALLGDRLRMSEHFLSSDVYIRSLASRGFLGGLSAKAIEVTHLMKAAGFDYLIIETVGVGQSEVEIASLADITCLVLVPESGDDIQAIKSGIMEIPDIFVVNKSDREGALKFVSTLRSFIQMNNGSQPIFQTVASQEKGVSDLVNAFSGSFESHPERKLSLMVEKVYNIIRSRRMKNISKEELSERLVTSMNREDFNLYRFAKEMDEYSK